MNWRVIRAIAVKDLKEVRQNRMAWLPVLILPLIFCVVIPLAVILLPQLFNVAPDFLMRDADMQYFMANLPPALKTQLDGLNDHQSMIVLVLAFMFAPMFLILPLMTASVVGADSFVGEKERKTIEALLYTPATDRELFVGKMLAAILPAVAITWLSFILYTVILDGVGMPIMKRIWFPTPSWWPLILWVTPAVATLGMVGAVLISARVGTFMEAYQSTGLLVLPIIFLVIGQISGVVYFGVEIAIIVGAIFWIIDAALLAVSLRFVSRAALMRSTVKS